MNIPSAMTSKRRLALIAIGLTGLAMIGCWWRDRPGGTGTHAMILIAARICPNGGAGRRRPSVGDGARAFDRAVLRRMSDVSGGDRRPCRNGGAGR